LRPIRDGLRVLATVLGALFRGVTKRTEGRLGLDGLPASGGWPKTVQFDHVKWLE
jgi:hypothetical protein